jgi:RNA polymerase sigma-70 factor (TIGR02957 family)
VADRVATAAADLFDEHRGLLFTVAYEMLGSTADAEDVLQEAYLRWADVDPDEVRDPRSYLVRVVTRQALNRLRTVKRRRETYVGPWLPEPLLTTDDVAQDVELADSVSIAMLVVLETLTPLERAVFVLKEVFGFDHAEIADATGRTASAVRQVASRAKKHVEARRVRLERPDDYQEIATRFFLAAATGEIQQLMDLMAPDVVMLNDGGGKRQAALRPIHGPDKVARFLCGVLGKTGPVEVEWRAVNGGPAMVVYAGGELDAVVTATVVDGRMREIFIVRNPDKLAALSGAVALTRS